MKKRKLKSLILNKKSVFNLEAIQGGNKPIKDKPFDDSWAFC
ncbi:hypothetical protein [Kordia sp.]|nr:hypothetical protein [Kordia sp.]